MSTISSCVWNDFFNASGLGSTEFSKDVLMMAAKLANTAMESNNANEMTASYDINGRIVRSTFTIEDGL